MKKILSVFLSLCVMISCMDWFGITAGAVTLWSGNMTYNTDTTINDDIAVTGNTNIELTIATGKTLTVNGYISLPARTLTVKGGGTLTVNGCIAGGTGSTQTLIVDGATVNANNSNGTGGPPLASAVAPFRSTPVPSPRPAETDMAVSV